MRGPEGLEETAQVLIREAPLSVKGEAKLSAPKEEVFEGKQVTLSVPLSKEAKNAVWLKNGMPLKLGKEKLASSEGKTQTLTLKSLKAEDSGDYQIKVNNFVSDPIPVQVQGASAAVAKSKGAEPSRTESPARTEKKKMEAIKKASSAMEEKFVKGASFPDANRTEIDRRKALSPLTGDALAGPEEEEKIRARELQAAAEAQSVEEAIARQLEESAAAASVAGSERAPTGILPTAGRAATTAAATEQLATSATSQLRDPQSTLSLRADENLAVSGVLESRQAEITETTQASVTSVPAKEDDVQSK